MGEDRSGEKPKHRWLAWVGLQEPPPDPDAWVPVATGRVDDPDTGASNYASAVVRVLADAGIEAHQRPYVVPDNAGLVAAALLDTRSVDDRVRVAVLAHSVDLERARSVVAGVHEQDVPDGKPVSEGEAALWLSGAIPPGT